MTCPHEMKPGETRIMTIQPRTSLECMFCERDRLRDELTQARLDLMNSDAIREEFVKQSVALAGDMARALGAAEAAFYAGYQKGRDHSFAGPDAAYKAWLEELKK